MHEGRVARLRVMRAEVPVKKKYETDGIWRFSAFHASLIAVLDSSFVSDN